MPGSFRPPRGIRCSPASPLTGHVLSSSDPHGGMTMATTVAPPRHLPWWKEPTKDQWMAWWAAWLGWPLDAFDVTVFLLIMGPISKEFGHSLRDVAAVWASTLW